MIDKTIFYYLLLFANFIINFAFIPIVFEVIQQRYTYNIPYVSIILFMIAQIIFLFVVLYKEYYFHVFIYVVGLLCSCILLFLKKYYDKQNTKVINVIKNETVITTNEEEAMNTFMEEE